MAIETVLLTTFLANAFVAANNAISDDTIDGGAANAVSCLPAFLRKDTSFEDKVKKLAKGLEAQMGPHADLAEQTITNAKDIVEHGTPKGFKKLLKQEGLDEYTLWKAFLKQPKAKKLYDDADATTRPHTEWLVKQGLKLWLDERIQNGAFERFHLELSFDTNQTVHRIEDQIQELLEANKGLSEKQIISFIQAFELRGAPESAWDDLLKEAKNKIDDLQAQLLGVSNDDPEVARKRAEAEQAIEDGLLDEAARLLTEAESLDEDAVKRVIKELVIPRRESQAKSAYARALLAESQINFQDAYTHALRAHKLAPDNDDYLDVAQSRAFHAGDYQKGLELGEEMMARAIINHGEQSKEYAKACNQTAICAWLSGDLKKAEPLFRRAMKIGEKTLEPNNPNLASGLNNLANLLLQKGDLGAAEHLFRRAIEIGKEKLGSNHPDLATSLNNLAGLLTDKGDLDEAEPLFRRDIKITEKARGPDHPDLATSLNNLAGLLRQKGDLDEAEQLYRRAIKITEKARGSNHPDLAISLSNLAGLLKDKGAFDAAEPLYQRAITILENAFPHGHPNLDQARKNYATMQKMRDQQ